MPLTPNASTLADLAGSTPTADLDKDANNKSLIRAAIGLGSVDDTSDVDKPVSTATQTALDGKEPIPASVLPRTAAAAISGVSSLIAPYRLTMIISGDSYAPDLSNQLETQVATVRGSGVMAPAYYTKLGTAPNPTSGDFTKSPTGTYYTLDAAGEGIEYGTGTYGFEMRRLRVFYSTESGVTGSFYLQSSTEGGAWTDVPGATSGAPISTDVGSGVSAECFTYDFTTTQRRKFRIYRATGTVHFLGMAYSDIIDSSGSPYKGGTEVFDLSFSGQTVQAASACPQAIFDVFLQTLKPNFIVFKSDDNATEMAFLETYISKCNTAWPADWVLVSSHPCSTSQANTLTAADEVLREIASSNGYTFIDARKLFPSYSQMQALGYLNGDNYHLSIPGSTYQNDSIARALSAVLKPPHKLVGNTNVTTLKGPYYWKDGGRIEVPAGTSSTWFGATTRNGNGTIPQDLFGVTTYTDNTSLFAIGPNQYGRLWFGGERCMFGGGTAGFGYASPPTKPSRSPSGTLEIYGGDRTTTPTLALSGTTGQTADFLECYVGATAAAAGTKQTARIKADSVAVFAGITLPPTGVAALPASQAINTFATVNDAASFSAGSTVAAGGSTKCLVQYDGSNWKMVLQLY